MKRSIFAITIFALATAGAAPLLAQTANPPVTMQPIPNPPEAAPMTAHKGKHHGRHKAAAAKTA